MKKTEIKKNAFFKSKSTSGFSLIEMLVYLALMTMISVVIVQSIVVVLKSNKESFNNNVIENSAVSVFERIKRETRRAKEVDLVGSNLTNGQLQMNVIQPDDSISNIKISLAGNGAVNIYETGVLSGPLTISGAEVTTLIFKQIKSGKSEAIRTEMTIKSGIKSETFYSTEILRGSY
jgi:competence protein ComGF